MTALSPSSGAAMDSPRQLGSVGDRAFRLTLGVGVVFTVGSVLLALMLGMDLVRFMKSYLLAFAFCLSICLGGLFFTVVQHVTRAGWSASIRRVAETIAANLQWIWILFIPIAIGAIVSAGAYDAAVKSGIPSSEAPGVLYSWMAEKKVEKDFLYQHKAPYLNVGFWVVRAVFFLAIWALVSRFFYRQSVLQDGDGDKARTLKMQKWAPLAVLAFAVTLTFAAIDWIMSMEAHWFSTMWGVYFFAMSACGFFATFPIVMHLLQRAGKLQNEVTLDHYQDMGKLLFAFGIVFHMYIAFSQFMLLWYANIPESTGWFQARTQGPWLPLMWLIPIGHFAIPFVLIVSKHVKRIPKALALIGVWMLIMHFLDLYLAIMPEIPINYLATAESIPAFQAAVAAGEVDLGWAPSLIDVTLVLGLVGLLAAATVRRLGRASLVAERDPRLHEALHFENL